MQRVVLSALLILVLAGLAGLVFSIQSDGSADKGAVTGQVDGAPSPEERTAAAGRVAEADAGDAALPGPGDMASAANPAETGGRTAIEQGVLDGLAGPGADLAGSPPATQAPDALSAGAADVVPGAPRFDIVRVEPSGEALIAGVGEPDTRIEVLSNGEVLAEVTTDASGSFIAMPTMKLTPGEHRLTLRRAGDAASTSGQDVAVVVPQDGSGLASVTQVPSEAAAASSGAPVSVPGVAGPVASLEPARSVAGAPASDAETEAGAAPGEAGIESESSATTASDQPAVAAVESAPGSREGAAGSPGAAGSEANVAVASPAADASAASTQASIAEAPSDGTTPSRSEEMIASAAPAPGKEPTPDAGGTPVPPADETLSASELAGEPSADIASTASPSSGDGASAPDSVSAGTNLDRPSGLSAEPDSRGATPSAPGTETALAAAPQMAGEAADNTGTAATAPTQGAGGASVSATGETPSDRTPDGPASADIASAAPQTTDDDAVAMDAKPATDGQRAESAEIARIAPIPDTGGTSGSAPAGTTSADIASAAPAGAEDSTPNLSVQAAEAEGSSVFVAGQAEPGSSVRVFANEDLLGETQVNAAGNWILEAQGSIPIGQVTIRADQTVGATETVTARTETPFVRYRDYTPLIPNAVVGEGGPGSLDAAADVPVPANVIIRRGDNLWTISRRTYGRGIRYKSIFSANTDLIHDPDLIYPGQVFLLPTERAGAGAPARALTQ